MSEMRIPLATARKRIVGFGITLGAVAMILCAGTAFAAPPASSQERTAARRTAAVVAQETFSTPQTALQALTTAAEAKDRSDLRSIFGQDYSQLLSGDRVEDNAALERFGTNLRVGADLSKNGDGSYTVLVGAKRWPFPIPIVKRDGNWIFDTKAGLSEILNRRVGENELSAIATCRAYVIAQWEYYTQSGAGHDGLAVYAQRFISTPGQHDGLYWPTAPGAKPSPFGDLVEQARAEGYGPRTRKASARRPKHPNPYHGYYFHILKRQGPSAPGGKFGYVINGNMIAGYALIAYPAKWGNSGVMTFLVNQQGRVYEKNLGPETVKIAGAMTEYNPDPSWRLVRQ